MAMATGTSSERVAEDPIIVELLAKADANREDVKVVTLVDQILKLLIAQKLAWYQRLRPRLVGTDPHNRGGYGISEVEVHALGSDIVGIGWSFSATSHAVCSEDDNDGTVAKFTAQLRASSPGLGNPDTKEVKYGSLSCSHTNGFLVAVLDQVPSEQEALCIDGRMNRAKMSTDTALQEALDEGLTWLVISRKVRSLYPGFFDLVQHARNATGAVQRRENEVQLLVRIQKMARQMSSAGAGIVNWPLISKTFAKRCDDDAVLPALVRYVQLHGGGDDGIFLDDLNAFHKVFVPTGRIIPASTFNSLNELKLEPSELSPFFMCAILKTTAAGPPKSVQSRICKFISNSDIASLGAGTRKANMLEAERILAQCRKILQDRGMTSAVASVARALARLDTLTVRFVLDKEKNIRA